MRGYLRRALENAQGAEQRLKPLTGSVYAGSVRRPESVVPTWGEETAFRRAAPETPVRRVPPETQFLGGAPDVLGAAPDAPRPVRDEPRAASVESGRDFGHSQPTVPVPFSQVLPQPLLAQPPASAPEVPRAEVAPSSPFAAAAPVLLLPATRVPAAPERSKPEASGTSAADEARLRQAPSSTKSESAPAIQPPPVPPPTLPARRDSRGSATAAPLFNRGLNPGRRAAEEPAIQVHIGRIEVIAATPPPPRAPAPRPNRSTSLTDYLAGRNGRS
jgi:hypothetical protein